MPVQLHKSFWRYFITCIVLCLSTDTTMKKRGSTVNKRKKTIFLDHSICGPPMSHQKVSSWFVIPTIWDPSNPNALNIWICKVVKRIKLLEKHIWITFLKKDEIVFLGEAQRGVPLPCKWVVVQTGAELYL